MRIIAGKFRGRKLMSPDGPGVRPTTDRLRESIFNVLVSRFGALDNARIADVFAGTGAFGLEALSRGANSVVFIEKHPNLLQQNIALLGVKDQTDVSRVDARALPEERPFDLIFLDPPYNAGLIEPALHSLKEKNWISGQTMLVVERDKREDVVFPDFLLEIRLLKQGKRYVHFLLQNNKSAAAE